MPFTARLHVMSNLFVIHSTTVLRHLYVAFHWLRNQRQARVWKDWTTRSFEMPSRTPTPRMLWCPAPMWKRAVGMHRFPCLSLPEDGHISSNLVSRHVPWCSVPLESACSLSKWEKLPSTSRRPCNSILGMRMLRTRWVSSWRRVAGERQRRTFSHGCVMSIVCLFFSACFRQFAVPICFTTLPQSPWDFWQRFFFFACFATMFWVFSLHEAMWLASGSKEFCSQFNMPLFFSCGWRAAAKNLFSIQYVVVSFSSGCMHFLRSASLFPAKKACANAHFPVKINAIMRSLL